MTQDIRISRETRQMLNDPPPGISAVPSAENIRDFSVIILGPEKTPYENGVFHVHLFLPENYPYEPPRLRFMTKIFHPNIDALGRICLDVIKKKWTPALSIRTILISLQSLLSEPNPEDPLDNNVAELWITDRKKAEEQAKNWTKQYAQS